MKKESSSSVMQTAITMREKNIDNFKTWRRSMRRSGKLPEYEPFKRDGHLAELIGVTLGDGTITKFPRTECLRIVASGNNYGFISRYTKIVQKVFKKKPSVSRRTNSNAVNITIYQCKISERIGIPSGAKGRLADVLPSWIESNDQLIKRYLRGLYEAEGSHCVHKPTYTYKFLFSNTNPALLETVFQLISRLGFHPHRSGHQVQISRRDEVLKLKNLLKFRFYEGKRS